MNKSIKGKYNPMYYKGTPVYVYDSNNNLTHEFNSVKSAVKGLKSHNYTVKANLDTGKLFRNEYYLYSSKKE
jgi:hypothetical protein